MASYYPERAASAGRGGWTLLSCRVGKNYRPAKCKIVDEAPEGFDFGKAGLRLASLFRLKEPKDGRSFEGARVRIPIRWILEGNTEPTSYPAGEPSMLVTVAPAGTNKGRVFSCPSKPEPNRTCIAHELGWTLRPELEDIAPIIRKGGDGASAMECAVTSSGALEQCNVASSTPEVTGDELLSIAKRFQAPPKTEGGTPTAGQRVVLKFDWKRLGKILDVDEAP